MKIVSIRIHNFRGIIDQELNVNSRNFCVYGGNGMGKSAVADAVDFLLSGSVTRLEGGGTQEVSLKKHGPHVGKKAEEAYVEAIMRTNAGNEFKVRRVVNSPAEVEIDDEYKDSFSELEEYAKTGAHFLSRKELLKFILTSPSERAKQIQALLNIPDIKKNSNYLSRAVKDAKKEYDEAQRRVEENKGDIVSICNGMSEIDAVNAWRVSLNGSRLEEIAPGTILKDIEYLGSNENLVKTRNIDALKRVKESTADCKESILLIDSNIKAIIREILQSDSSLEDIKKMDLIKTGLSMLDGSGKCPLCNYQWESEDVLKKYLITRKDAGEEITALYSQYKKSLKDLRAAIASLIELSAKSEIYTLSDSGRTPTLEEFCKKCSETQTISDVIEFTEYEESLEGVISWVRGIDNKKISSECDCIILEIEKTLKSDEETKADSWNKLRKFSTLLDESQANKKIIIKAEETYNKILHLQKQYDEAQTTVLNRLYDDIKNRFVTLYRLLHGSDEASFDANMERSKSGIGLSVDFHEQGQFPPAAYHSEGHQDSMGIALFFSLMERLACKEKGIIVLDDVVMSVDIDHRLAFCDMLKNVYSDFQFLITTHDAIWEKYLEKHKIVDKRNAFNFVNWSVELGPEIITKKDVWSECEKRADEDLNSAAHFLRREMETYFEEVCDSLNAEIKYNSERKWDLGQYYNAAYAAMKKDLSKAKKHAGKYKMTDKSTIIEERIDELAKAKEDVDCNNWITNILVHQNSDQFSRREFSTAIESLKRFANCFRCATCGGIHYIAYDGMDPSVLRCECGDTLLTLSD